VDDIDHWNRRVRRWGTSREPISNRLVRMSGIKESLWPNAETSCHDLINPKPYRGCKEFFGLPAVPSWIRPTPLSEITHKPAPFALGPGVDPDGRFEVRDVHPTHYA